MRIDFLLPLAFSAAALAQAPPPPPVLPNPLPDIADSMRTSPPLDPGKPRLTNMYEIFSAKNYPRLAREREVEGRVKVRVDVGPEGLATECKTLGSPPPELGGSTCALILAEGRFEPARDRRGRTVKGRVEQTVVWMLADLEPSKLEESTDKLVFSFDDAAVITDCKRERAVPKSVLDAEAEYEEHHREKLADPCKALGLAAKFMVAASGLKPLSEWQVRMESLVRTGEVEFWRSIGTGPDERMIQLVGFTLEIASDGKVTKCTALSPEQELLPDVASCEDLQETVYVAASEPKRHLHMVTISYLKRHKAGDETS